MKIILANGIELNPIVVTGGGRHIYGANRDTLNFIFPAESSLDELDALFTDTNCESIKLYETTDDGAELEYIHSGYTVRAELSRTPVVVREATDIADAFVENRVTVSMAQRTYTEKQVAEQGEAIGYLLNGEE